MGSYKFVGFEQLDAVQKRLSRNDDGLLAAFSSPCLIDRVEPKCYACVAYENDELGLWHGLSLSFCFVQLESLAHQIISINVMNWRWTQSWVFHWAWKPTKQTPRKIRLMFPSTRGQLISEMRSSISVLAQPRRRTMIIITIVVLQTDFLLISNEF